VRSPPGDNDVGRTRVFDLAERPFTRLVRQVRGFGNDAIKASTLERLEPSRGHSRIGGHWRQMERRAQFDRLQYLSPPNLGLTHEVLIGQEAGQRHVRSRMLRSQFGDLPSTGLAAR
jgi:hypothetical protein